MANIVISYLDTVYLTLWSTRKSSAAGAPWERDAGTAIYMSIPILMLTEALLKLGSSRFGFVSLASVAPNRVVYGLAVFLPICVATTLVVRNAAKKTPSKARFDRLRLEMSKRARIAATILYFLMPSAIFVYALFS